MADNNTVNVGINVSDNGTTQKVTKNVKVLKDVLDQAVVSAAKLAMGGGTPAPRMAGGGSVPPSGGGRAAIASAGGARPPGGAASAQAEYGAMRGVAGSTGAGARDFAKEAEGMNGLVRVYAAFAATTYAVAAAFSALSKAMDTSNMVQGLNQLGAASGVSLGNLSKRLVDTTEGAISLRQAMQSVAQASAAGISSANILKMGDVAKKASQALGIDMSDALSRISRGVTKLEPELLDELGIFTKLNESNAKYAVTLGKSVGALTDFEKRQGFANAVIDEATKKFGDLKIDANPYSKLLATFQNLAQTGLELVNKVVAPIVGLLSSNPMALAGVLTYIGINLLSKTIPAIGRWQEGLKDAAEQAKITSESVAKSFDTRFQTNLESRFKLPGLKQSLAESEKEFAKLSATTLVGPMAAAPKNLGPNATTAGMDSKGLSTINDLLATRNTRLETGYAGAAKMSATQVQATKDEVKWLEAKARAIEQEIALTAAAGKVSKDKAAIDTAQTKIGTIADKKIGPFDPQTIGLKQAEKARINYEKLSAVAAASEMASTNGVRAAWVQLGDTIKEKGITGIDKFTTLAKGGLAAVGTRLTGIISAFGIWGQIAAAGVAIFEVLDSFASKNAKEAEATSKAFSVVTDAVTTLGDTMDVIAKKDALGQISTESRNASATAINGLIAATKDALDKAGKEILAANWWDILKDKVSMLWGGDVASKSIKATAGAITKALSAAEEGGAKNKALGDLKILLGGDLPKTAEELEKKLKSLDKSMGGEALKIIDTMGQSIQKVASEAMELDEAFKNASKTFDSIVISALPTDPIAKLGQEYMIAGEKMATAIKDPTTALEQLAKVSGDTSKLKMFSPELAADLVKNSDKIKENAAIVKAYTQAALDAQAKIDAPPARVRRGTERAGLVALGRETSDEEQKNIKAAATNAVTTASAVIDPFLKKMAAESAAMMEKGAKFIQNSIAKGFAEGRAILSAVYAARLGDTEAGIKARAQLAKEEIDRSIKDIEAKKGLVDSQEALRKAVEENTIEIALSTLERSKLSDDDKIDQAKQLNMAKDRLKLSAVDYATKYKEEVPKGPTAAQLAIKALDSQIFKLRQSAAAIDLKTQDELAANASRHTVEQLDANNKIAASRKELNKLIEQGLPYVSEETLKAQQIIDIQVEQNSALKESKVIRDKIATSERTIADLTTKRKYGPNDARDMESALAARNEDTKELALLEQTQAEQKITNDRKRVEELRTGAANRFTFEQTLATRSLEIAQSKDKIQAADKEATIVKLKDAGVNAAIILANFQSDLDKKTERERSAAALAALQKQRDAEIKAKTDIVEKTTLGTSERGIAEQDLKSVTTRYDALIAGEKSVSASKQIGLDIAGRQNIEAATYAKLLADQKIAMDALIPVAESLSTIFGDVGKKFSDGMLGILKATQDAATKRSDIDLKYAQDKKAIEAQTQADIKELYSSSATEEEFADSKGRAIEKGNKDKLSLEKKFAKDSMNLEFDKNAKTISSAKNMFSEKTAAYKIFSSIEKAMHTYKMLMDAKEVAMDLWKTGQAVFNSMTRTTATVGEATVDGAAGVINQAKGDPYSAPFRMAAMAASVAVLLASIGGSFKGSGPSMPSVADQQKHQNTGETYNAQGQLVETGGGVFGDPTAKMGGWVSKSLEIIKDNSIEGLYYSDKMTELLSSINDNIGKASSALFQTTGIRTGSLSGVNPGSSTSGGGLTGAAIGIGIDVALSAALGLTLGPIGLALMGLIGAFTKTKTDVGIIDSGLMLEGSFYDLAHAAEGSVKAFNKIETVSQTYFAGIRVGGSRTPSTITQNLAETGPEGKIAADALNAVFANAENILSSIAIKAGQTQNQIDEIFKTVSITSTTGLKGLKGQDLIDETSALVAGAIDKATQALLKPFKKYAKDGEELITTAIRVEDSNDKINTALGSLGINLKSKAEFISTTAGSMFLGIIGNVLTSVSTIELDKLSFDVTDNLEKLAGGMSVFTDRVKFFREHFMTEAQRAADDQATLIRKLADLSTDSGDLSAADMLTQLTTTMTKAGVSALDTRDSFAKVLTSIDVTAPAGAILYTRMMALAESFDRVAAANDKLKASQESQYQTYLDIIGLTAISNKLKRKIELAAMDSSLRSTQEYIYALQDEKAAKDAATSAIKNTINSLTGSIKTLKDYQTSLSTSAQGTMTPEERYETLRQELLSTQTAAMGPTDTPAQLAAQQAAAAKLPQTASAFLDASRVLNASSSKYSDDLKFVQDKIKDTITLISGTADLATTQLAKIEATSSSVAAIDATLVSTKTLMERLVDTQVTTNGAWEKARAETKSWEDKTGLTPITNTTSTTNTTTIVNSNPISFVGPIGLDLTQMPELGVGLGMGGGLAIGAGGWGVGADWAAGLAAIAKAQTDNAAVIVEAVTTAAGATITANATVVANQTLTLTNNATNNIETINYNGRNYKLYPNQMED